MTPHYAEVPLATIDDVLVKPVPSRHCNDLYVKWLLYSNNTFVVVMQCAGKQVVPMRDAHHDACCGCSATCVIALSHMQQYFETYTWYFPS